MCRQCSLSVCHKTWLENKAEVDRYVGRFPVGSSFSCFYDTHTLDNAIDHKVYTQSDAIHCLLWPLVVIAICVLLFLYVELSSRGLIRFPCGKKYKDSVTYVASPSSSSHASPH